MSWLPGLRPGPHWGSLEHFTKPLDRFWSRGWKGEK